MDINRGNIGDELTANPEMVFRHSYTNEDLPRIAEVINSSNTADRSHERITTDELANIYLHPIHWDPQQDMLLVEIGEKLIGYANTEWREEDNRDISHNINLHLVADWRNRGLELIMQRHMEQRARQIALTLPEGAHWYASRAPETWRTRTEMLLGQGYSSFRHYFEMQRSLDDDLPNILIPSGLVFRQPLPEHYRLIWEASEECFRDQEDHVAPNEESYHAWVSTPDLDPSLWLVAWDGDQVAGAVINVTYEGTWGETDDLFVRRPWRKQGLGRALLIGSLHLFKARGLITAGLGVNAENQSGALKLYEGVGYRPYQRVVNYRKLIYF
jgi:mycothiol synthase